MRAPLFAGVGLVRTISNWDNPGRVYLANVGRAFPIFGTSRTCLLPACKSPIPYILGNLSRLFFERKDIQGSTRHADSIDDLQLFNINKEYTREISNGDNRARRRKIDGLRFRIVSL